MSTSYASYNYGTASGGTSSAAATAALSTANTANTNATAAEALATTTQANLTTETTRATTAEATLVPKTTTVNGHALNANITISASDVGAINTNQLGVANGVATLDSSGKLPSSLLNTSNLLSAPLTGYVSTNGTVVASDTILSAIEKLNGNIATAVGGGITGISVASSNGFTGTSSGGNTPIITLGTSVNGLVKGGAGVFSTAVSGTDYMLSTSPLTGYTVATSAGTVSATDSLLTAIGKLSYTVSNITTGVTSVAGNTGTVTATQLATALSGQTINAATVTTNANLTGVVTSVGNATSIANSAITNIMLANTSVANLSGTNTGDETLATIKTKLGVTTLSGSNTGDQTIILTGAVTGSGTGSFATSLTNASVTGQVLTGLSSNVGQSVVATDSIIMAIGKLNGTIAAMQGTTFNNQTGTTYTTVLTDASFLNNVGNTLTFNNAATQICTIPLNSSVAYAVGATMQVIQLGVGKVTFAGASGVTINSAGGLLSIGTQFAAVTLMQTSINNWILVGALQA